MSLPPWTVWAPKILNTTFCICILMFLIWQIVSLSTCGEVRSSRLRPPCPSTWAPPLDPTEGFPSPRFPDVSPQPWRQNDAYDKASFCSVVNCNQIMTVFPLSLDLYPTHTTYMPVIVVMYYCTVTVNSTNLMTEMCHRSYCIAVATLISDC